MDGKECACLGDKRVVHASLIRRNSHQHSAACFLHMRISTEALINNHNAFIINWSTINTSGSSGARLQTNQKPTCITHEISGHPGMPV